ncbi:hydantoinase B/oxoprolinase family protein [Pseudonocardia sp. MCCB 268]|nr:hydantoinase B/oxoprolinase family protein [Pseudonocardia cytotoxica]
MLSSSTGRPRSLMLLSVFRARCRRGREDAVAGDYDSLSIHNGHGVTRTAARPGSRWRSATRARPWGATKHGDADSYNIYRNNLDPATGRPSESDLPIVVLRKEYVIDSAGIGYHRGGARPRCQVSACSDPGEPRDPRCTQAEQRYRRGRRR